MGTYAVYYTKDNVQFITKVLAKGMYEAAEIVRRYADRVNKVELIQTVDA